MKVARSFVLLFLLWSGLCLGWSPFGDFRGPRERLWTVMVYISAEPHLDDAVRADLLEMAKVGSTEEVAIVAQVDWERAEKGLAFRYVVYKGRIVLDEEWVPREINVGDPAQLVDFISWAKGKFPARNYLLVFWGHGLGWRPRRPVFLPIIKGVMTDLTGDLLENHEVKEALSQPGVRFNIVAFDSCLMQMVEVAYELRGLARYMVGSEEVVPAKGYPYDRILKPLVENPQISSLNLANLVVDEYLGSYTLKELEEAGLRDITMSVVDLLLVDELAGAVSELSLELISSFPSYQREILSSIEDAERFEDKDFKDLKHFALLVRKKVPHPQVGKRAEKVLGLFDRAVPYSGYRTGRLKSAHGLSIYLPRFFTSYKDSRGYSLDEALREYRKTSFSSDTAWDEFIFFCYPVAIIEEPEKGQTFKEAVEIKGKAFAHQLEGWRLEYGRGEIPGSWSLIAQGDRSVIGPLTFWDISNLPDDLYSLRLKVRDVEGREAKWVVSIVLNQGGTYPVATITQPKEGQTLVGEVVIKGTALSKDLAGWRLEYGKGREPRSWSIITKREEAVKEGLLGVWDTTKVPDGLYTLRLKVWNEAGKTVEGRVIVEVDNSYPSIVGTVVDARTGLPLEGAMVEALGPEGFRAFTYTDPQGKYSISNLKPARYTLRAYALGYKEAERPVEVKMQPDEWRVDFSLEKAPARRPGAISGLVYLSVSREPLGKAEVKVIFGGRVVASAVTSPEVTTEVGYRFNYLIRNLEPLKYEVRVSLPGFIPYPESRIVEVREDEETKEVNFSMSSFHYIGRGLQMVSVPYDYSGLAPDPAALLSVPPKALKMAKWEPGLNRYAFYPDPPADKFRIGEGYWLYLDNPASIAMEGVSASPAQPYPILLRGGWNMIGAPFTFSVDWFACEVIADGKRMSVEEAIRKEILGSGLWTYEFGSYRLAFTLDPWKGYWVRAFKSCTLLVSNRPISGRAPTRALKEGVTPGGWALRISVEAGEERDEENFLGLLKGGGVGYDPALDILEPPPVGLRREVRAYFDSPAGPLAVDIKGEKKAEWTLSVEIPSGAYHEVRVTWKGLKSLPRDVSLVLEDPVAGRAVFMRSSSCYSFKPRQGEKVRRLRIRASEDGARLRVAAIRVGRLKGKGGILVNFLLTAPGEAEVRLLSLLGREVARAARSPASSGWNRVFLPGRILAPGVYLVEVKAKGGEEGREARLVKPVLLR